MFFIAGACLYDIAKTFKTPTNIKNDHYFYGCMTFVVSSMAMFKHITYMYPE